MIDTSMYFRTLNEYKYCIRINLKEIFSKENLSSSYLPCTDKTIPVQFLLLCNLLPILYGNTDFSQFFF